MRKINWTKYEYISLILIIVFFASMIIYLITITPGMETEENISCKLLHFKIIFRLA